MSVAPYPIKCYRDKSWVEVQTDKLLPGDLVSVGMLLIYLCIECNVSKT